MRSRTPATKPPSKTRLQPRVGIPPWRSRSRRTRPRAPRSPPRCLDPAARDLFVRLGERLEVFPRRPILFDGRQDVRGDPPLELPLRVALVIEDVRDPRQAS